MEAPPTVCNGSKAKTHLGIYKAEVHRVNPEAETHHHPLQDPHLSKKSKAASH